MTDSLEAGSSPITGAAEAFLCFLGAPRGEAQAAVRKLSGKLRTVSIDFLARLMDRARGLMQFLGSGYQALRANLPPVLRNFLPERLADSFPYLGGFLIGVIKTLIGNFPISLVFDLFDAITRVIEQIHSGWQGLRTAFQDALSPFLSIIRLLKHDVQMAANERGEAAGGIVASATVLIMSLVTAVATSGGTLVFLAGIPRQLRAIAAGF